MADEDFKEPVSVDPMLVLHPSVREHYQKYVDASIAYRDAYLKMIDTYNELRLSVHSAKTEISRVSVALTRIMQAESDGTAADPWKNAPVA